MWDVDSVEVTTDVVILKEGGDGRGRREGTRARGELCPQSYWRLLFPQSGDDVVKSREVLVVGTIIDGKPVMEGSKGGSVVLVGIGRAARA